MLWVAYLLPEISKPPAVDKSALHRVFAKPFTKGFMKPLTERLYKGPMFGCFTKHQQPSQSSRAFVKPFIWMLHKTHLLRGFADPLALGLLETTYLVALQNSLPRCFVKPLAYNGAL